MDIRAETWRNDEPADPPMFIGPCEDGLDLDGETEADRRSPYTMIA